MSLTIRRLGAADAPVYRELRLRALREHPDAFTSSFEEESTAPFEKSRERLTNPQQRFWGAFDADALIGMVGLECTAKAKARHKGKVVAMYVAPEAKGRGAGRALLAALIDDAARSGLELLVLTVTDGNAPATRIYEQTGFRSFGVEPNAIKVAGRRFGKRHMALELDAT